MNSRPIRFKKLSGVPKESCIVYAEEGKPFLNKKGSMQLSFSYFGVDNMIRFVMHCQHGPHFYEVIRGSRALHYDLEWYLYDGEVENNPLAVVQEVIRVTIDALAPYLAVKPEDFCIAISTRTIKDYTKHSYHVNLVGRYFEFEPLKHFILGLSDSFPKRLGKREEGRERVMTSVVDFAVYSSTRSWRLVGSRKVGTDRGPGTLRIISEGHTFVDALCTNFHRDPPVALPEPPPNPHRKSHQKKNAQKKEKDQDGGEGAAGDDGEGGEDGNPDLNLCEVVTRLIREAGDATTTAEAVNWQTGFITCENNGDRFCLIAKRAHSSTNRAYCHMDLLTGHCTYRCYSSKCKGENVKLGSVLTVHDELALHHPSLKVKAKHLEVYDEEYVRPLSAEELQGVTVIRSGMDTGKTTLVKSIASQKHPDGSWVYPYIFVVTCRVQCAETFLGKLAGLGFVDYRHLKGESFDKHKRIVCQYESSGRHRPEQALDLFVVDEAESVMSSVLSSTTNKGNIVANALAFRDNIVTSRASIILDADISKRTLTTLAFMLNDDYDAGLAMIRVHVNQRPYQPRHMLLYKDRTAWEKLVLKYVKEGRKVVVPCTSIGEADTLDKMVKNLTSTTAPPIASRLYSSKSDSVLLQDFRCVDQSWAPLRFIVFTPTLTVSADYQRDDVDHLFLYADSNSVPVTTALQMLWRVRNPKSTTVHVYIKQHRPGRLPCTLAEINADLEAKIHRLRGVERELLAGHDRPHVDRDTGKIHYAKPLPFLYNAILYNTLHVNLSKRDWEGALRKEGAKRNMTFDVVEGEKKGKKRGTEEEEEEEESSEDVDRPVVNHFKIGAEAFVSWLAYIGEGEEGYTPDLAVQRYQELEGKVTGGEEEIITALEKDEREYLYYQRFYVSLLSAEDCALARSCQRELINLRNARLAKTGTDLLVHFLPFAPSTDLALASAASQVPDHDAVEKLLLKTLGFPSLCDTSHTVSSEAILAAASAAADRPEKKQPSLHAVLAAHNALLRSYYGGKLVNGEEHRTGSKRKREIQYKLVFREDLWDLSSRLSEVVEHARYGIDGRIHEVAQ